MHKTRSAQISQLDRNIQIINARSIIIYSVCEYTPNFRSCMRIHSLLSGAITYSSFSVLSRKTTRNIRHSHAISFYSRRVSVNKCFISNETSAIINSSLHSLIEWKITPSKRVYNVIFFYYRENSLLTLTLRYYGHFFALLSAVYLFHTKESMTCRRRIPARNTTRTCFNVSSSVLRITTAHVSYMRLCTPTSNDVCTGGVFRRNFLVAKLNTYISIHCARR